MNIERIENGNLSPQEKLHAMQKRHREALESSGITHRAIMNAVTDNRGRLDDVQAIEEGTPIVLGAEQDDTKLIYIAFQHPVIDSTGDTRTSSKAVIIGSRVNGIALPNTPKGYQISDFELVERMYDEAKELRAKIAADNSSQQGATQE